jgi:WD40 repeat protein
LQKQFIGASGKLRDRIARDKKNRRKQDIRNTRLIAVGSSLAFAVSSIFAVIAWNKTKEAELNLADSLARNSLSLLAEGKELDAFVEAIKAGKILKKRKAQDPEVTNALQEALNQGNERNRLLGHDSSVLSVSISSDGQTLVSGSLDNTIKIWNLETGELRRTLTGHDSSVYSVSISSDGQTLVSGSDDKTIKIWNLETGELRRTLTGHDSSVYSVSISSDGQTLVSGSLDNTIKIWNLSFDWLMARNCDQVRVYLANPNSGVKEEDRGLCDGIGGK